jgi:site-specific DNA recombinase
MHNLRALTGTPPRAVVYLRQSTYREESISLELQEIACRDYCDRHGYEVIAVESDPGISGRTWNRKGVQNAMSALETRTADIVVLWKWSRLSRSRKDWALAIDRADLAGGKIESATEPIDTATASGRFARGVMTEYAAFQSEQIGEQWEEVRQRRLTLGKPVSGRLPFGWIRGGSGAIEPHAEQAPLVVEMYRRYLAGDGAASIAQWLNSMDIAAPNGGLWRRSRPLTVMDSPIHAGLIPYRGAAYPGEHEPILERQVWDEYLAERARRRETNEKPRAYTHLLSNVMRCQCGARMHGKGSVTGGKLYRGYLCGETLNGHEGRAYVSALAVEPLVEEWLLAFDPDVDTAVNETAHRAHLDRVRRDMNALEVETVNISRQNAQGVLPESTFLRAMAEIRDELERLADQERRLARQVRDTPSRAVVLSLREAWPVMPMGEQNRALRQLVDEVQVRDSGRSFSIQTVWGSSSEVTA